MAQDSHYATLSQEQFHIAEAEQERVVQLYRMGNELSRKNGAGIRLASHPSTMADPTADRHPVRFP
ncbi:MAG TPA: hypothetical protein VD978_00675 [Azospirillum sp.]|nr:hypothetical protein [Azospirillum sp.]